MIRLKKGEKEMLQENNFIGESCFCCGHRYNCKNLDKPCCHPIAREGEDFIKCDFFEPKDKNDFEMIICKDDGIIELITSNMKEELTEWDKKLIEKTIKELIEDELKWLERLKNSELDDFDIISRINKLKEKKE